MEDPGNRVAILEEQVRALLHWQQAFCTTFTPVLSDNYPNQANVHPVKLPAFLPPPTNARHQVPTPPGTPSKEALEKIRRVEHMEPKVRSAPFSSARDLLEVPKTPFIKLATEICDIIQRYGQNINTDNPWASRQKWLAVVEECVEGSKPVRMILPAFPWKSVNKVDKVTGALPDFGEQLAMSHLNGLCESIAEVYEHGAELTIASDGLVYNDLLGIPDEETWLYGEALRKMTAAKGFSAVRFIRIMDLFSDSGKGNSLDEYLDIVSDYRKALETQYGDPNFDIREVIHRDEDYCMTYCGYIKFLKKDLVHTHMASEAKTDRQYRKYVKEVAAAMICRGLCFAKLIETNRPDYVRLSIHPSTGGTKLSVPLVPHPSGRFSMTPWHCSVAVGIDGQYRTAHAMDLRETHDLIYKDGRPYLYRERSNLFDWAGMAVEFEHLYPCGLIVRPTEQLKGQLSLRDIDMGKLRKLTENQSPVILRGFADTTEQDMFVRKGGELGIVIPGISGPLHHVIDSARSQKPDGSMYYASVKDVAETEESRDAETKFDQRAESSYRPKFKILAYTASDSANTETTLFASSPRFFQFLPPPYTAERLAAISWKMDSDGFWNKKLQGTPLVVRHPVHDFPCLRWDQPWPASKTDFLAGEVPLAQNVQDITELIDQLLSDRRVSLRFTWERGDVVVSDDIATRIGFTGDGGHHIWCMHLA